MSKKDKDGWRKMSRTRRDICVEVWRAVAFGGRMMPIHSNLDGREPRMEIPNPLSSLAGEPCWSNPKEPINADCAGQPPSRVGWRRVGMDLEGKTQWRRDLLISGRERM